MIKEHGGTAVPYKSGAVEFRAAITAISCTATVDEHEISKRISRHTHDKIAWSDFECTKCSPKGVGQEARSNAGIS